MVRMDRALSTVRPMGLFMHKHDSMILLHYENAQDLIGTPRSYLVTLVYTQTNRWNFFRVPKLQEQDGADRKIPSIRSGVNRYG